MSTTWAGYSKSGSVTKLSPVLHVYPTPSEIVIGSFGKNNSIASGHLPLSRSTKLTIS